MISLVPVDEPLIAEVSIANADIGFVVPAQSMRAKIAAYQFQKYGMLEGIVKTVSADASTLEDAARKDSGYRVVFIRECLANRFEISASSSND
jgi:hemolysin D